MHLKELLEELKQLSPAPQVVFALGVLVLLVLVPTAGTSILTFLVALKTLTTR